MYTSAYIHVYVCMYVCVDVCVYDIKNEILYYKWLEIFFFLELSVFKYFWGSGAFFVVFVFDVFFYLCKKKMIIEKQNMRVGKKLN